MVCAAALTMMRPDRCQENFILACRKSTVESGVRARFGFGDFSKETTDLTTGKDNSPSN